jgi:hypothetical protein
MMRIPPAFHVKIRPFLRDTRDHPRKQGDRHAPRSNGDLLELATRRSSM